MRTLAGSAIGGARKIYRQAEANAPLRRAVTLDQLGGAALYLLSDLSGGVTGEAHHVDSGYHVLDCHLTGSTIAGRRQVPVLAPEDLPYPSLMGGPG